jgi:uncharacterized protein YgiM (DUF1202 family)
VKRLILILTLAALACSAPALTMPTMPVSTPTAVPTATRLVSATRLPEITATSLVAVTAARSLHVRVRPGERETVLGYLYTSDTVTLTGSCRSGWAQIQWQDATAWVNASFLSENNCQTSEE